MLIILVSAKKIVFLTSSDVLKLRIAKFKRTSFVILLQHDFQLQQTITDKQRKKIDLRKWTNISKPFKNMHKMENIRNGYLWKRTSKDMPGKIK